MQLEWHSVSVMHTELLADTVTPKLSHQNCFSKTNQDHKKPQKNKLNLQFELCIPPSPTILYVLTFNKRSSYLPWHHPFVFFTDALLFLFSCKMLTLYYQYSFAQTGMCGMHQKVYVDFSQMRWKNPFNLFMQ